VISQLRNVIFLFVKFSTLRRHSGFSEFESAKKHGLTTQKGKFEFFTFYDTEYIILHAKNISCNVKEMLIY